MGRKYVHCLCKPTRGNEQHQLVHGPRRHHLDDDGEEQLQDRLLLAYVVKSTYTGIPKQAPPRAPQGALAVPPMRNARGKQSGAAAHRPNKVFICSRTLLPRSASPPGAPFLPGLRTAPALPLPPPAARRLLPSSPAIVQDALMIRLCGAVRVDFSFSVAGHKLRRPVKTVALSPPAVLPEGRNSQTAVIAD